MTSTYERDLDMVSINQRTEYRSKFIVRTHAHAADRLHYLATKAPSTVATCWTCCFNMLLVWTGLKAVDKNTKKELNG